LIRWNKDKEKLMKKLLLTILIMGVLGICASEAMGQVTPRADRRQRNQTHRVNQGINSGEITRREARSVRRSTRSAKRYERRAKADGKVTWKERARLQHKENKASRKIYRVKHNNRTRN
jgi:hypothetical protein